MPFFEYNQNNSGGFFKHDDRAGIGYAVIVEANNAREADYRAENIGLYFDGVANDRDCECCGGRWCPAYGDGDPEPLVYGKPPVGGWGLPAYVHYADGRVESYPAPEGR